MSIAWLQDLVEGVIAGKDFYACPCPGKDQWQVARSVEELRPVAKLAAAHRRLPVSIFRLVPPRETASDALFLVPVSIDPLAPIGEPQVRWATIGTLEAALVMRDVRHGPAPVFGTEVQETIQPE